MDPTWSFGHKFGRSELVSLFAMDVERGSVPALLCMASDSHVPRSRWKKSSLGSEGEDLSGNSWLGP
jgi:hypothetical protein